VTFTAGNIVQFVVTGGCSGFVIQYRGATPTGTLLGQLSYSSGTAAAGLTGDGTVTLTSTASTPMLLTYKSVAFPVMTGSITVTGGTLTKPPRPTGVTVTGWTSTSATVSWTAVSANALGECEFAWWLATATPSTGSDVTCNSTSLTNTTCFLSGLAVDTSYTVTVQIRCLNPAANSDVSFSASGSTKGGFGPPVICQNVDVCNCGNASTCACQLSNVCNCDHADLCTCQGGTCNGGYSTLFICESTKCNKQCAETCIGPCMLGDIPGLGGLFGGRRRLMACTISGQSSLSASAFLLSALALFASWM